MEEKINADQISWIDADAVWLYPILKEHINAGKDIGMDYLSLGSLRFGERYFVGYFFNNNNRECPIEIVTYIQYKMTPARLTLNYMEVARKYRGNGLARVTIDTFADKVVADPNIQVCVTTFSDDGLRANLLAKLQKNLHGDIEEVSKRNAI